MNAVRIKSPKAKRAEDCTVLEQLPNIGPALAADLRLIGVRSASATEDAPMNSRPITNDCASPSGRGCTAYSICSPR